ncbi:hypothetical protein [Ectopseudomonas composti]|jgi:hypothetical protein|uniref:hypothetical protein n=1 Tax=Ectopseudomonas composti TaxID=658457 RepID=UPI000A809EE3|nr:hypothetical protein [Pseudomonas composti]
MAQFTVYSNATVIGYSELESGDAPMGVAFGAFKPTDEYSMIRHECLNNHLNQDALKLSVHTNAGLVIPCAGVSILDYSAEAGTELIELNILGIPYQIYNELFPEHVASYNQQFH